MKRHRIGTRLFFTASAAAILLTGCGSPTSHTNTQTASMVANGRPVLIRVTDTSYNAKTGTVNLMVNHPLAVSQGATQNAQETGEDVVDMSSRDGVIGYATARYPDKEIRSVDIYNNTQPRAKLYSTTVPMEIQHALPSYPKGGVGIDNSGMAGLAAGAPGSRTALPPGVRYDASVHPLAPPSASAATKFNAIMRVAQSKLGTPYIWGHNEDRGQYGFDCSNFTEYVYHHALGYLFTTASRGQNSYVGWAVSRSQMQPGDLVIFEQGAHVGIYAGNQRVIQEGGGLKKVGYLSVAPRSYWGQHITAVKRMY